MTRHNTTPTHLTDAERFELSSLSRHADWCDRVHCRCPVTSVLAAIERILAARGNNTTHEGLLELRGAVESMAGEMSAAAYLTVTSLLRAALSPAPTNEDEGLTTCPECHTTFDPDDWTDWQAARAASEGETNP